MPLARPVCGRCLAARTSTLLGFRNPFTVRCCIGPSKGGKEAPVPLAKPVQLISQGFSGSVNPPQPIGCLH